MTLFAREILAMGALPSPACGRGAERAERVTREQYANRISLAADANFNVLRVWGGRSGGRSRDRKQKRSLTTRPQDPAQVRDLMAAGLWRP